jgi:hypothetical protein
MSRYLSHLISLDSELRADKKLMRKLFTDKQNYGAFMQVQSEWILEKAPQHDFSKEEVHGLLIYL